MTAMVIAREVYLVKLAWSCQRYDIPHLWFDKCQGCRIFEAKNMFVCLYNLRGQDMLIIKKKIRKR